MVGSAPSPQRRDEVLQALRSSEEPLTVDQLADALDVHRNTVRFHLRSLIADGRVELLSAVPALSGGSVRSGGRGHPGRPAGLFAAVKGMDPSGPRNYRLLAEILGEALTVLPDVSARAIEAGRVRGTRLAESVDPTPRASAGPESVERDPVQRDPVQRDPVQRDRSESDPRGTDPVDRLTVVLDRAGFAPERDSDDRRLINLRHCPFLELAESGDRVACRVHLGLMRGALEAWDAPYTVDRLEAFVEPDLCRAHLVRSGAAA